MHFSNYYYINYLIKNTYFGNDVTAISTKTWIQVFFVYSKKIFFVPRTFLQKVKNIIKKKNCMHRRTYRRMTRFKLPSRAKNKTQKENCIRIIFSISWLAILCLPDFFKVLLYVSIDFQSVK